MKLKLKNTVDYVNITNLISSPIFMQSPPTKPDIKTNTSTIPATLQALSSHYTSSVFMKGNHHK